MEDLIQYHTDPRQTQQWCNYMLKIGWEYQKLNGSYIFIKQIKPLKHSIIKISHPIMPLDLQKVETIAKGYNALFVLIEPHIKNYDQTMFETNGFSRSNLRSAFTATRLIDLRLDKDTIWESISENARRNIKKAIQSDIKVQNISAQQDTNLQNFDKFYTLYQNVGKLKNFYTQPYQESKDKFIAWRQTSNLLFALHPSQSEPIAAVWYIHQDQTLTYLHTGITNQGYQNLANYLLAWEGILLGKSLGMKILDFESVFDSRLPRENKKWLGYSEFKSRFHGTLLEYPPAWIKIYNIPYKILYLCATKLSLS